MATQRPFKVRLHVISPIHIGCDDVYEPTGFVVDRSAKKLISFEPIDFVGSLDPGNRAKFLALCDKGTLESILEIYKFMAQHGSKVEGYQVDLTDGFLSSYDRVLRLQPRDIKQELNKFLIARTSYLPRDQSPYIPGSALKGALRTGWLNHLNQGTPRPAAQARRLEEELLGGTFAADPFRMVKVSDLLPVERPETRICFAVNKKKKPSKFEAGGPQQILETIRAEKNPVFEGMITLHAPERGAPGLAAKVIPADATFFAQATNFFAQEMIQEEEIFKQIDVPGLVKVTMQKLFGERYMTSVFPIRIGRHAGAEAVTIAGARNIKIMGKRGEKPKDGPASTTLWLAGETAKAENNLHPFGWAALEILDVDPAALWPERSVVNQRSEIQPATISPPPAPTIVTEVIVWEGAFLTWSAGDTTLTAKAANGVKAMMKLTGDRSMVPAALHKKLFEKKDAVKSRVTVKKEGNCLQIVSIE